jgi:hypothetical protein
MSTLTALAKALAVEREQAQPVCLVRHVHLASDPLVLIVLALAGEANAPLAALVGSEPGCPRLLTVSEPRDRDQRFAFAGQLAGIVLGYLERTENPQLIVSNPAAVEFIRLLGRSMRLRRTSGDWAVPPEVPLLGRWLTFFADRADYPASSLMLAMTDVLAQHWSTGQSDLEDGNLATLLAWIDPAPGMTGAQAARLAEDPLTCPPAGPATDPTFDNEVLEHRLRAIRAARLTGDGRAFDRARTRLDADLTSQLAPAWKQIWRAIALLRGLPPGAHVPQRWEEDRQTVRRHAEHIRDGGPPQPRRDGAVGAASRLARLERAQEMAAAQRAFDDPLVMAQYRMTGEAFAGEVVAAEADRVTGTGRGKKLRPLITVATRDEFRRPQEPRPLSSPARLAQKAELISIEPDLDGLRVTLELSGGMGRRLTPEPGSVPAVGERVCYAALDTGFRAPPSFPEPPDTPWTHGGPPPQYIQSDGDAKEAWS